jgi:hypothetical protein
MDCVWIFDKSLQHKRQLEAYCLKRILPNPPVVAQNGVSGNYAMFPTNDDALRCMVFSVLWQVNSSF